MRNNSYARHWRSATILQEFEVVELEALAAASVRTLEEDEGRAEEAVRMHLVGDQPGGSADNYCGRASRAASARPSRPDVR